MTFDPTLSTDKDVVRFLIGDTDTAHEQVADATLVKMLTMYAGPTSTAQAVCVALQAKYSRLADQQIGQLRVSTSQIADHYSKLADKLRDQAQSTSTVVPVPYAGGITQSDKQLNTDNSDVVRPFFTRDMDNFSTPGVEKLGE